jgi:hypothetical protein
MSTRTDVHAPSNLVTEDYEFVACGYFGTAGEPGYSPLASDEGRHLIDEGWAFGENHSAGGCYHCGARIKYYAILKHLPSHTLVRVGEQCLDNRFDRSTAEFHQLRKQAQLDREQQRIKNERLAWFAIDPDREVAFGWAMTKVQDGHYGYEGMRHSFVSKINRYGSTSDKFVKAIMRDMVRTEAREEQRAVEQEQLMPVVEGRGQIEGQIISVKWQDNDFGGRVVMTVKDDRGFLVWGTVPRPLVDDLDRLSYDPKAHGYETPAATYAEFVRKNEVRVRFTATVEKSDRDESFGFFKRPTKTEVI